MYFECSLAAVSLRHRSDAHERALLDVGKRCLDHARDLRVVGERHLELRAIACLDRINRAVDTFDGAAYTNRVLRHGRCDTGYHHPDSTQSDPRKRSYRHLVFGFHKFLPLVGDVVQQGICVHTCDPLLTLRAAVFRSVASSRGRSRRFRDVCNEAAYLRRFPICGAAPEVLSILNTISWRAATHRPAGHAAMARIA